MFVSLIRPPVLLFIISFQRCRTLTMQILYQILKYTNISYILQAVAYGYRLNRFFKNYKMRHKRDSYIDTFLFLLALQWFE